MLLPVKLYIIVLFFQLNWNTLKKTIWPTQCLKKSTLCTGLQQSKQSALSFQDFSGPHSTDKTHVAAESTNLETRWALWPSPGTTPTACKPTQHDGYLCVSAEIVAGIIAPPVQVRGRYSWGPFLYASLRDTTEQGYSSSSVDQTPKVPSFSRNVMRHC